MTGRGQQPLGGFSLGAERGPVDLDEPGVVGAKFAAQVLDLGCGERDRTVRPLGLSVGDLAFDGGPCRLGLSWAAEDGGR